MKTQQLYQLPTLRKHVFFEWKVMVDRIIANGAIKCIIGMPPIRDRQTKEEDERARVRRPRDRSCELQLEQVAVDGLDFD